MPQVKLLQQHKTYKLEWTWPSSIKESDNCETKIKTRIQGIEIVSNCTDFEFLLTASDVLGRVLFTKELNSKNNTIDLTKHRGRLLLLRLSEDGQIVLRKKLFIRK